MLNDEICKLRDKLNESIINGNDYNISQRLLDKLKKIKMSITKER
jgi:hypothetical protein